LPELTYSISKSFVSRREAASSAVARQGKARQGKAKQSNNDADDFEMELLTHPLRDQRQAGAANAQALTDGSYAFFGISSGVCGNVALSILLDFVDHGRVNRLSADLRNKVGVF
jgi:ribonuclease HI